MEGGEELEDVDDDVGASGKGKGGGPGSYEDMVGGYAVKKRRMMGGGSGREKAAGSGGGKGGRAEVEGSGFESERGGMQGLVEWEAEKGSGEESGEGEDEAGGDERGEDGGEEEEEEEEGLERCLPAQKKRRTRKQLPSAFGPVGEAEVAAAQVGKNCV